MKLKVVFASLAIAVVAVAAFAFVPAKKRTSATYYYVSNTPFQRIQYNTSAVQLIERSLDKDANSPAYFLRSSSWQNAAVPYTSTTDMTAYIGSISFDEESVADGGSDGQLTLDEALAALRNRFLSTQAMPSSLVVDGNAAITVDAATAAH